MTKEPIILYKITKKFKDHVVLNSVSATFKNDEVTCIIGPSGAGKTTLLNIILNIIKPDSGSITGTQGRKLSAVFQEDRLCEELDAIMNIKLALPKDTSVDTIKEELSKVELVDYENKPVSQLSGGMRRRVSIVRAMMTESDIIIMDEPFKGLDERLKDIVMNYVKEKVKGKVTLLVTHDNSEVNKMGKTIFNLLNGGNSATISHI